MLIENKKSTEHDITFRNIYYFSSRDITHALASEVLLLQFYIHTTLLFSAFRHRTVANTLLVNRNPAVLQHVEIAMSAHRYSVVYLCMSCSDKNRCTCSCMLTSIAGGCNEKSSKILRLGVDRSHRSIHSHLFSLLGMLLSVLSGLDEILSDVH